jgi:hypothetical protein
MKEKKNRVWKKSDIRKAARTRSLIIAAAASCVLLFASYSFAQDDSKVRATSATYPASTSRRSYPKEIRGYKVERAKVDIRKSARPRSAEEGDRDSKDKDKARDDGALIYFGEPRIVRTTPLGITLEVPVTIAAVKQGGRVDFLTFEDMVVNGMPVTIEDYMHSFELPNKEPATLPRPIRLFISSPRAIVGALNEWSNPQETWPVTGRVYVFGHYRKFIFTAKRVVPVELSLTLPNPLRNEKNEQKLSDPAIKQ